MSASRPTRPRICRRSAKMPPGACSTAAIRAGGEEYAREHGTRGATTLLKSNVRLSGGKVVTLSFKAKGGKIVTKEVKSARFHAAVVRLLDLPGRRLFQCR